MTTYTTKVITGKGRGKFLGFPTLNLTIPNNFNFQHGIYAGWVYLHQQSYKGAFHFGPIPTFQDPKPSLEVFVLETNIPKPPKTIDIQLVKHLRPIKSFSNPESLTLQIQQDVLQTQSILKDSQQRKII